MTTLRRKYTPAEELALTTQVEGRCPLCGHALFYKKHGKGWKRFELAHIYPLNPSPEEIAVLSDVQRLSEDVNDADNLIPLCTDCHTRYDKPRTREEYIRLAAIKHGLIRQDVQTTLNARYPLDAEISSIVAKLGTIDIENSQVVDLELTARPVVSKLQGDFPSVTRRKIRNAVSDYYPHVKRSFAEIEKSVPTSAELIYAQVRAYYTQQKALGLPQVTVFHNTVAWITQVTQTQSRDAAEIIASFFVQNCEVFE